ncbi:MAG: hypothetical protein QXS93_00895 [Candidatus Micrarchaeia archaeon]
MLDDQISMALLKISQRELTKKEVEHIVLLTRISNQVEQFADSIKIISNLYSNLRDRGVYLSDESMAAFLSCSVMVRENLELLLESELNKMDDKTVSRMRQNDDKLRAEINSAYKEHLKRIQMKSSNYGSLFIEMLSTLDNANDRLRTIRKMLQ